MINPYKKEIRQIQLKGGNEEKECPICMEDLDEDDKLITSCNHSFHTNCFVQNCLAELRKDNFSNRDEENKVFQCPNCRGDTKADCLNDTEVRDIYEGLQLNRDGNNDDRLEFQYMIDILETNLNDTILNAENGIIDDDAQDLFLEQLYSYLLSNDNLSNAVLAYIFESLEHLLDNAEIEYDLNDMMIYNFTRKIREEIEEFEEHDESEFVGGKLKREKKTKRRTKKSKGKGKGKKTKKGKKQKGIKKTKKGKRKSRRRNERTITQGV